MKTFKKVLASALAAAMVVTAFPVTNAEAASTAKLSTKKATIYVGQSKTIKVTTPKTWKSVKVTASKKGAAAKITKVSGKKVTVKAVKAGTAKVTVKVTAKKGKKAVKKTLTFKATVKNPTLTLQAANEVAVGAKETVKATVKPASTKVTFSSSDETIATVDASGVVTGVKTGKVTITAKAGKTTATKDIEVKNYVLANVAQAKLAELTATVSGTTKNLKASDFTIKNATTNVVYPVSKVSVDSKDATKVTLTLFSELKDEANYDVTLDGVTKSFKASDGKVASIGLDKATIPYATETEIKLVSKDANGVVIAEIPYSTGNASYDFTIDAKGNGYTNGSKLYLNKVGDTAEATITYKSGKYNQNGQPEGNIGPNKVTITAVEQSAISNFAVRIDAAGKASFDKAKDTNKIAAGETKVAYFNIKNADGKEIAAADYSAYTVESSDKTVLMIASTSIASKNVGVTAVKSGTAYILFKNKDGKIVNSVAVDVVAARTVASLDLDKYSVSVSKKLGRSENVVATLKDQYGDDMTTAEAAKLVVTCLTKPDNATGTAFTQNGKTITFTTSDAKGTYVFKIAYVKDGKEVVAKTVTVNVVDTTATAATSWKLNVKNNNVDIKVDEDNKTSQDVVVEMIGSAEGVELYAVPTVTYTVKKADGTVIYNDIAGSATVTNSAISVSGGALTVKALTVSASGVATKNIAAGTYTVTAKGVDGANTANITTTFTIKDTQAKASVEVKKNVVDAATLAAELGQALVVTYGDYVYTNNTDVSNRTPLTVAEAKIKLNDGSEETNTSTTIASGKYYSVSKLVVTVTVATGVTMDMEVSVPGTITVK